MDLEQLIATAAPRTKTVQVCGRGDLASEHERLAGELQRIMLDPNQGLAGNPAATEVARKIEACEAEMAEFTMDFTVKALSRNGWADLLAAHPPTREQAKAGEDVDPRTFPVAAVAACSHTPKMDLEQAQALASKLPVGEWQKLWLAVMGLNTAQTTVPKLRAATALLEANASSSTTSDPVDSPEAPSLGGSGAPSPSTTTTTTAA